MMNSINVAVTITQNKDQTFNWSYDSDYPGFNKATGKITFQAPGETAVTYTLQGNTYQLIYVNLDPATCATREIRQLKVNPTENTITLVDANSNDITRNSPFSLSLVARVANDLGAPIVSPDPEVENDPGNHEPGGQ